MLSPKDFVQSPEAMEKVHSLAEAQAYTRWLATSHYENFHVVSMLLPKRLHDDFYNVYSFCRWADDLGDEIGDTAESLRLLAWWRVELHRMYERGEASHPVFVALRGTAQKHGLLIAPFDDLITAFIQDQTVTRYADWDALLSYCKNSANPVGRLVLGLCGYRDAERLLLSGYTCTALQLANFWQDVAIDLKKDRVYIPLDVMARHGYTVDDLFAYRFNPAFAAVMKEIVDYARDLFHKGLPLPALLNRRLAIDIDLFSRGGMKVLDKIEEQGYDVLKSRPRISKGERVRLLLGTLARVCLRAA